MALSAKRVAYGGVLACLALIFSYVETFLPLNFLIPVPGFKLGFANICVLLASYLLGLRLGAFIAISKVLLLFLLFGNPMSLLFSLCGTTFSFAFLMFAKLVLLDRVSFIGISVGMAALHNVGQIFVACVMFSSPDVFLYLEWLLPVSVIIATACEFWSSTPSTLIKLRASIIDAIPSM